MRMNFSIPVAALIAGAALGYCARSPQTEPAEPAVESAEGSKLIADAGDNALRARIAELEAKLAKRNGEETEETAEKPDEPRENLSPEENRRRMMKEMREGFEKWRKEHPEEFAKMQARHREMMARRSERMRSRREFLESIDSSRMTATELETHERLQELIAMKEDVEAKLNELAPFENEEERHDLHGQMHEIDEEMRELNRTERDTLLRATAEELGYSGDDADAIVMTVKEIYDATQLGGMHGPPPEGGRGPR